jgi:hypothetical protein
MTTVTKHLLSESVNGRPIAVAATASPGTKVHTAASGTNTMDEVYLMAVNITTVPITLTIEAGGISVSDQIKVSLAAGAGAQIILNGPPFQNTVETRVFAEVTNVINVFGWVHRVAQ